MMLQQRSRSPVFAIVFHDFVQGDPTSGSWRTASCNSGFCASPLRGEL